MTIHSPLQRKTCVNSTLLAHHYHGHKYKYENTVIADEGSAPTIHKLWQAPSTRLP